jgi:hypothetical protein
MYIRTGLALILPAALALAAGCQSQSARTDSAGHVRSLRWYGAKVRVGMSKADAFAALKNVRYPAEHGATMVGDRPTEADYPSDTWYVAYGDSVDIGSVEAYVLTFQEGRLVRIHRVDLGGAAKGTGGGFSGPAVAGAPPAGEPQGPLNITYRREFMQFTVPHVSVGGAGGYGSTSSHVGP